jgi:6-phosphofructokinase
MLYIIGGDGTHRGAHKLQQACAAARIALDVKIILIPPCIFYY